MTARAAVAQAHAHPHQQTGHHQPHDAHIEPCLGQRCEQTPDPARDQQPRQKQQPHTFRPQAVATQDRAQGAGQNARDTCNAAVAQHIKRAGHANQQAAGKRQSGRELLPVQCHG